jgi:SAM-dependent methyltransferase
MLTRTIRRVRKLAAALPLGGHEASKLVWTGFRVAFGRTPDEDAERRYTAALTAGRLSASEFLTELTRSPEFANRHRPHPLVALHAARLQLVKGLPKADTIVDLGGGAADSEAGALVLMGYPYRFDTLTIVEPPPADRHDIYKGVAPGSPRRFDTGRGVVHYQYSSMADLSGIPAGSVDLVFSGESIEHVSREDCVRVLEETRRVLKPTGWFCFDTPNRAVTRVQVGDELFVNPDHKHEYTHPEMRGLLERTGFEVVEQKGVTLCPSAGTGAFDVNDLVDNVGLYDEIEDCYLLYYRCRVR